VLRTGYIGLLKMELPDGDIRLCDGGFIEYDSEVYTSKDDTFGTIGSLQAMTEGVGDEVPALELEFLPNGSATPGDLGQPGFQQSRSRLWLGEYDLDTGLISGTPDLLFDGQVDQCTLKVDISERSLAMTVVSTAERLFQRSAGNNLSDGFHQSVWPGELGEANATGLTVPIAWGVESPQRSNSGFGQFATSPKIGGVGYSAL
jgi:hypothetical protein